MLKTLRKSKFVLILVAVFYLLEAFAKSAGKPTILIVGLLCAGLVILASIPNKNQQ